MFEMGQLASDEARKRPREKELRFLPFLSSKKESKCHSRIGLLRGCSRASVSNGDLGYLVCMSLSFHLLDGWRI